MNSINIIGRIGKDIETKFLPNSTTQVAEFSVGVTRKMKKDVTDWFNCVAFGKNAENIAKFFGKGSEIGLSGEINFSQYTNKDGINVNKTTFKIDNFSFTGGSKSNSTATNDNAAPIDDDYGTPVDDGDMPF